MSRGLNCPHCKRWVDKDMCHVSQICPYCGARMTQPPATKLQYVENPTDDGDELDEMEDTMAASILLESVFDSSTSDPYAGDEDPSFQSGGGDFGGGGADDSW